MFNIKSSNYTSNYLSKDLKYKCLQKEFFVNVHTIIIHNSARMKKTFKIHQLLNG